MYPTKCEIDGKTYELNTDYKIALACFKAIEDEGITDIERAYAVVGLLFGDIDVDMEKALDIATKFLCCGKENKSLSKKDMDFDYDKDYITASFMSDYGLDLDTIEYMHWWKYCALISGLTEKCILNKVRDIRNTDLSEYKDSKSRSKIIKAMRNVELPHKRTQEEQEMIDEFEELLKGGGNIDG